jgi:hypothetical protein
VAEAIRWGQEVLIDADNSMSGIGAYYVLEETGDGLRADYIDNEEAFRALGPVRTLGDMGSLGFLVRPAMESVPDSDKKVVIPGSVRVGLTERRNDHGQRATVQPEALGPMIDLLGRQGVGVDYERTDRPNNFSYARELEAEHTDGVVYRGMPDGYATVAVEPIFLSTSKEGLGGEIIVAKREAVLAGMRAVVAYSMDKVGVKRGPQKDPNEEEARKAKNNR